VRIEELKLSHKPSTVKPAAASKLIAIAIAIAIAMTIAIAIAIAIAGNNGFLRPQHTLSRIHNKIRKIHHRKQPNKISC
jgi:hypothetical protein